MKKWLGFWALGIIWGSSFLLIRIGVGELNPFELVFIRTGIAAVGLNLVLLARGKHLPLDGKVLGPLALIGLGNTAIPFALITWGETSVDSGLASVLQATASLFTLAIAHFYFADERITPQRIGGLMAGFVGVVILASRSWVDGQLVTGTLLGQLAIVLACVFYAAFTVYSRKVINNKIEPLMVSSGAMTFAALASGAAMLISPSLGGRPLISPAEMSPDVLGAVVLLGVLNTFIAYLIFYSLVPALGAARTSMVTYVTPPVGLFLGVLFLNEPMDARLLLGAAMIFVGIAIVNLKLRRTPVEPAPMVQQEAQ